MEDGGDAEEPAGEGDKRSCETASASRLGAAWARGSRGAELVRGRAERLLLHASALEFTHPSDGRVLRFVHNWSWEPADLALPPFARESRQSYIAPAMRYALRGPRASQLRRVT